MLMGGGGSSNSSVSQISSATPLRPTPEAVANIQTQISIMQGHVDRHEPVPPENISGLSEATSKLTSTSQDELSGSRDQVTRVLQDADSLLANVATTQPEVADQAKQAQEVVRGVASSLGAPFSSTTPPASATPAPSGEATPVPPSTPPTEAPTVAPTPEGTATTAPAPTDTPVERGLPGG
jgi:hypothetical protein